MAIFGIGKKGRWADADLSDKLAIIAASMQGPASLAAQENVLSGRENAAAQAQRLAAYYNGLSQPAQNVAPAPLNVPEPVLPEAPPAAVYKAPADIGAVNVGPDAIANGVGFEIPKFSVQAPKISTSLASAPRVGGAHTGPAFDPQVAARDPRYVQSFFMRALDPSLPISERTRRAAEMESLGAKGAVDFVKATYEPVVIGDQVVNKYNPSEKYDPGVKKWTPGPNGSFYDANSQGAAPRAQYKTPEGSRLVYDEDGTPHVVPIDGAAEAAGRMKYAVDYASGLAGAQTSPANGIVDENGAPVQGVSVADSLGLGGRAPSSTAGAPRVGQGGGGSAPVRRVPGAAAPAPGGIPTRGQSVADKSAAAWRGKTWVEENALWATRGDNARATVNTLDTMERAIGQFQPGRAAPTITGIKAIVPGTKFKDEVSAMQVFNGGVAELIGKQRTPGEGPMTDQDAARYARILANPAETREAGLAKIRAMKAANQREVDVARFRADWDARFGPTGRNSKGWTWSQFYNNYLQAHPLFGN